MNSKKLNTTNSIVTVILFAGLVWLKNSVLFLTAFVLFIAKGIQMSSFINETQVEKEYEIEKRDYWKFFLFKLAVEVLPIVVIGAAILMLITRKEVWLPAFTK
jgi:hypothetical protein